MSQLHGKNSLMGVVEEEAILQYIKKTTDRKEVETVSGK